MLGRFFVRQLEHQNLNTFKQTIELPSYVDNSLAEQLSRSNTKKANKQINQILSEVNNNNISEIRVVDSKSIVRGTSNADNRSAIGQKTTDQAIKATLLNNRSHTENLYDNSNHTRYYVNVIPSWITVIITLWELFTCELVWKVSTLILIILRWYTYPRQ